GADGRVEDDRDVDDAVTVVDLADLRSVVSVVDGFEEVSVAQPEAGGICRAHADYQFGRAGLRNGLRVIVARHARHDRGNVQGCPVDCFEILAKDLHHDSPGRAGNGFLDALRQERHGFTRVAQYVRQGTANLLLGLLGVRRTQALQVHLQFAVLDP